jgi:hypothetical protein
MNETMGTIGELLGGNVFEEIQTTTQALMPVYLKLNAESGTLGLPVIRLASGSVVSARPFVLGGTATFIGNGRLNCVRVALHSASIQFDRSKGRAVLTPPRLFRAQEWRCKQCRATVISGLTGAEYHLVQRAWELQAQGRALNAVIGKDAQGQDVLAPSLKCGACGHDHAALKPAKTVKPHTGTVAVRGFAPSGEIQDIGIVAGSQLSDVHLAAEGFAVPYRKSARVEIINLAGCESSRAKYEPEASRIDDLRAAATEAGPVDLASYGLFKAGSAPGVWEPSSSAQQAFDGKVKAAGFEARPLDELMKLPVLTGLAVVLKPIQARQFGLIDPAQLSCKNAGSRSNVMDHDTMSA